MALGAGKRIGGTAKPRTTPSHKARMASPKRSGTAMRLMRFAAGDEKLWRTSHSLKAQAASQNRIAPKNQKGFVMAGLPFS
ncbi:hypothetical protein D3C72_2049930 [compost metagenome]